MKISVTTTNSILFQFEKIGIIKEITKQKRNKIYIYNEFILIMDRNIV